MTTTAVTYIRRLVRYNVGLTLSVWAIVLQRNMDVNWSIKKYLFIILCLKSDCPAEPNYISSYSDASGKSVTANISIGPSKWAHARPETGCLSSWMCPTCSGSDSTSDSNSESMKTPAPINSQKIETSPDTYPKLDSNDTVWLVRWVRRFVRSLGHYFSNSKVVVNLLQGLMILLARFGWE